MESTNTAKKCQFCLCVTFQIDLLIEVGRVGYEAKTEKVRTQDRPEKRNNDS